MININNILRCFPNDLNKKINEALYNKTKENYLEEIRLRVNKPVILKIGNEEVILDYIILAEGLMNVLATICENSIYTYQEQICKRIYYDKRWT